MQRLAIAFAATTALCGVSYAEMSKTEVPLLNGSNAKLAEVQHFNYWALDNVPTIDPGLMEAADAFDVARQVFEGLFEQDEKGNTIPALAIETKVSEDLLTYTFTLRDNAKWTDGRPVTAHDFVYAWRRVADPATASNYSYYMAMMGIKNAQAIIDGEMAPETMGVKALNDYLLEVTLEQPKSYFTKMLAMGTTYPVPRWAIEEHGDAWTSPANIVSNGAYIWAENTIGEQYTVKRNPMYWNNENTILDSVTFKVIADENQAFLRYQAGELDHSVVPTGRYPELIKEAPEHVVVMPNMCVYYLSFNQRPDGPDFAKDYRVRKALSLAIDRELMVRGVMRSPDVPTWTFTHGMAAGFTPHYVDYMDWTQDERDAEAVRLLAEAGYGPDNPLEFTYSYNTSEGHKKLAIYFQQQWKQKLGVQSTLENMEWKTFLEERNNGNFEVARDGWCADYNEPSTFLDLLHSTSPQSNGRMNDPTIDALLDMSKTMEDPQAIYTIIEGINADKQYVAPLYDYTSEYLIRPTIKGFPVQNAEQNFYFKNMYVVEAE